MTPAEIICRGFSLHEIISMIMRVFDGIMNPHVQLGGHFKEVIYERH